MLPARTLRHSPRARWPYQVFNGLAAATLTFGCPMLVTATEVDISPIPLIASVDEVHPLLVLTPSVEWPTINSVANVDGNYSPNATYVGYFDADKCYGYHYDSTDESEHHFFPVSNPAGRDCNNTHWSGNFLNWVATQTIDAFRLALTGGYRIKDTLDETWLEKARHDGQGTTSIYPNRSLDSDTLQGATPLNGSSATFRIQGLGNEMRFRINGTNTGENIQAYNPSAETTDAQGYRLSVRVKVCNPDAGLEDFCVQYGDEITGYHWKPEGLLQEYADKMQVAVFGYLNDHSMYRDGGVMRARKKWVGPQKFVQGAWQNNSASEWDPITGILKQNPDIEDATAGSANIEDSGAINYLNKFGQMTDKRHKSHDPVSELFYAALRYLRNEGNVSAYSNLSGTQEAQYELADGFPVIENWDDPVAQWCQPNAILGIGDIYTHRDKNLPGTTARGDEPASPSEVSSDDAVDVHAWTQQVASMEGVNIGTPFTGRQNSAYMAGLAWDANVRDLRPDLEGKTRARTYWVDVLETRSLEGMSRNQFALAAKYGGMKVPESFDPDNLPDILPEVWWHTNGETLTPFGSRGAGQTAFKKPDNFFLAGDAEAMVDALKQAFGRIVADTEGSSAALAIDGATVDAEDGSRIFQVTYTTGSWSGELAAYDLDSSTGEPEAAAAWYASLGLPNHGERNIRVNAGGTDTDFLWGNLTADQQAALGSQAVLEYLRGDNSNEASQDGMLRTRVNPLGDIVHSQPVFVGPPNPELYADEDFPAADTHPAFAQSLASRREVLYVGANDGMLHVLDVDTGTEIYAFVPSAAIEQGMATLAAPSYEHRYLVDGEITVADVPDSNANNGWRSVLVGTMGRGGRAIFALDVTDPDNISFLWEKSANDISALGNVLGKPMIAPIADGTWRVIVANGPNGQNGEPALIQLDVFNGTANSTLLGEAGENGLTGIEVWDSNNDGYYDIAYGGDLKGNLWKIGLNSGTSTLLFTAKDDNGVAQPISAAPIAAYDAIDEKTWVFFGTGRYLNETDLGTTQVQSWYGLIDEGTTIPGRFDLLERSIGAHNVVPHGNAEREVRNMERGDAGDLGNRDGWYIDLKFNNTVDGERMIIPNQIFGPALVGTTRMPNTDDPCRPTGRGFVYAINPFSGAALDVPFFILRDPDGEQVGYDAVGFDSPPSQPVFVRVDGEPRMLTSLEDQRIVKDEVDGRLIDQPLGSRLSWRELRAP
ncbi:pilus assembly protein [Ectothiorhodospira marina]|uniref:Type IV pilus assembly protein PilY1 n=1 Tax=Ectothiorhodospira marina TaxID=1396821 RepID=A0A1H7RAU2_9GAMM|nr:PilC/PilY family type IV pilus protein [Ectothiorhodospira marina]SEL57085.1 type IV pilus assembly protein PilY1 [Ectothiorhodospira marina]